MSFYSEEVVSKIKYGQSNILINTITNLADTPYANVIISHGLGEYAQRYDTLTSFLLSHNYNVFRYDQIGHGETTGEHGYMKSAEDLWKPLQMLVKHVRNAYPDLPTYLIGHSMGGEACLLYGTKFPNTVDGIIASSPVSLSKRSKGLPLPMKGEEHATFPNVDTGGINRDQRVVDHFLTNKRTLKEATVGIMNNALWNGALDLRKNLNKLVDPILFLQGVADAEVNYQDSFEAFDMISSSDKEMHVYPFVMHEVLNDSKIKWKVFKEIDEWMTERKY
ncbi:alpha/beta fold hydrolase [Limosilactobacillus sp.]|uniref:alpha/beta fold hydrolase n=1 Tax=Limosilactobacillus sp. TaxID=2773925 RepID=UPI0025C0E359|nr:alpha/beta fold hydrolase [Limosilactobacillus sp.]MCH3922770.1 lysophospholipase [Limosilactobacillus sp.]MCH3927453.1 lysophospholipase [Limosilactobacillus sp.]